MPWKDAIQAAIGAVPSDVDVKAIRKCVSDCLKARKPSTPVSPHTQFIQLWCEAYKAKYQFDYVFMAKDAAAVKKLLASFTVEHLMRIVRAAWDHRETYPCSMSGSLPKLLCHINEIRTWLNESKKKPTGKGMPAFKQLEMLKQMHSHHVCNPNSIHFDPDIAKDPAQKDHYADLKRRIQELEQAQRKQVMA